MKFTYWVTLEDNIGYFNGHLEFETPQRLASVSEDKNTDNEELRVCLEIA